MSEYATLTKRKRFTCTIEIEVDAEYDIDVWDSGDDGWDLSNGDAIRILKVKTPETQQILDALGDEIAEGRGKDI